MINMANNLPYLTVGQVDYRRIINRWNEEKPFLRHQLVRKQFLL